MILRRECAKAMIARPVMNGVLGFRPHTYWAAVVVLGRSPQAPRVLERARFEFAGPDERFVYHRAAKGDYETAAALIEQARGRCRDTAAAHIGALLKRLDSAGVEIRLAATMAAAARLPEDLPSILQSHALIHAAEGNLGREVIAAAGGLAGLEVHQFAERELAARLHARLGSDEPSLPTRMRQMGATLGPPWGEDYRLAAQAAWLLLD